MQWTSVAPAADFQPGRPLTFDLDGTPVAIVLVDGQFLAVEDICTHDGGDLAGGDVEGDLIVCPRHGAKFCLRTGQVKSPPAYEDIRIFPVRVENGMVQVRDARCD